MKYSECFISLITIYILPKTFSQDAQKVPGPSSCTYYGNLMENCGEPTVPATDLPKEATSISYYGLTANVSLDVAFSFPNVSNDEHIKSLLGSGKPVFLAFGREDRNEYMTVMSPNSQNGGQNAKTELTNLKKFLEPYPNITGIELYGLTSSPSNMTTSSLTENFKIYLDVMRSTFPDYVIGLSIHGTNLIDMFAKTNPPVWFDFSILDPLIDFYRINLINLNNCTDEFKVGGTSPINGSAQYTIDKVRDHITTLNVPKNKTYYMFQVGPKSIDKVPSCELTIAKICAKPNLDGICFDDTQSYYDKGAYAKQNGAGFIVLYVDKDDDPHGSCHCETGQYPAFHTILAGFNGGTVPPVCPLLDKK